MIAIQPLLRRASQSAFESIASIRAPILARQLLSRQASTRAAICIQCQIRVQRRHFADDARPNGLQKSSSPSRDPVIPNNAHQTPAPQSPELPSAQENRRSVVSKRLTDLMDNLQGNIFIASQRLNDLTGYSGIEALKVTIRNLEASLAACQEAVRATRDNYKKTIANRAASQREVTTLLARKDTWTPADLERFTSLYRSDHGNEQAVQEAATRLADAERAAEQAASKLSSSIMSRYHEEQIWSDKIRRMSTWGTWGLMGVNVLLFLVFQFGFEPWRRRRLVRGFEEKVMEALEMEKQKQAQTEAKDLGPAGHEMGREGAVHLDNVVAADIQEIEKEADGVKKEFPTVSGITPVINYDATESEEKTELIGMPQRLIPTILWRQPTTWKGGILDLFSERMVLLRKQDITIIALESAAAGATLVGLIVMLVLRPN
jgi:sensitive to high expression protein 9, mitochondrial